MAQPRDVETMVAAVDLFADLSRREVRSLLSFSQEVEHPAGKEVATEGSGALAFHLVLDGQAEVSRGGTVVHTLGAGDYFGEISMIDGKPRSATVTATTPLRLLAVPHQSFESLLTKEPAFARALLRTLCARLRRAEVPGPTS